MKLGLTSFKFLTTPPPSRPSRSHMASRVNIPQILYRASRPTKQCTFQYLSRIFFPQVLLSRQASGLSLRGKTDNRGKMITPPKKKKKARPTFRQYDLKKMEQFSLCDAMRYTLTLVLCHFTSLIECKQLHNSFRSWSLPHIFKIRPRAQDPYLEKRPYCAQPPPTPSSCQHQPKNRCDLPLAWALCDGSSGHRRHSSR